MMTIGWWIGAGVIGVIGIVVTISVGYSAWEYGSNWVLRSLVCLLITAVLFGGAVGVGTWYCNNTAEGARAMKDQESNLNNGLHREIIVTAEDGREIFYYKGKCDIETDHSAYILFEDEDGYRHIIYKGVQDTIIVNEIPQK
jgi:hypothetical protein